MQSDDGLSSYSLAGLGDRLVEALYHVASHLVRTIFVNSAERLDRPVHIQVRVHLDFVAEASLSFLLGEFRGELLLEIAAGLTKAA